LGELPRHPRKARRSAVPGQISHRRPRQVINFAIHAVITGLIDVRRMAEIRIGREGDDAR